MNTRSVYVDLYVIRLLKIAGSFFVCAPSLVGACYLRAPSPQHRCRFFILNDFLIKNTCTVTENSVHNVLWVQTKKIRINYDSFCKPQLIFAVGYQGRVFPIIAPHEIISPNYGIITMIGGGL